MYHLVFSFDKFREETRVFGEFGYMGSMLTSVV